MSQDYSAELPIDRTIHGIAGAGAHSIQEKNVSATVIDVKDSAGVLYSLRAYNESGAKAYIQVFFQAAADIELGVTGYDHQIEADNGGSSDLNIGMTGLGFGTGLSIASTTSDGGAVGSAAGVRVEGTYV